MANIIEFNRCHVKHFIYFLFILLSIIVIPNRSQ